MKTALLASSLCLTLLVACNKEASKEANKEPLVKAPLTSGIYIANIDKSVRPQDDFYRYVNGTWLDNTKIPSDKSTYGSFTVLRDKSREDVKAIIGETAAVENLTEGSDSQKIADMYRSYMNTDKLNELGMTPIIPELEKINAISNANELAIYFAESEKIGTAAPFGFYVSNDSKEPTRYITYFTQSGLGLPDREYYLKDEEKSVKLRADYVTHVSNMFKLANVKDAQNNAEKVMALETEIAKLHWKREDRRDRNKTYNKIEAAKLSELVKDFNWDAYFRHAGLANVKEVIVREKSYFENFSKLLKETEMNDWKIYFKWKLLKSTANILSAEFNKENFAFYGTALKGTPEQEARWKRAVNSVNGLLGELVGKLYVKKHFQPEAKVRMVQLVENLRESYRQAITDLDWMSEETKKEALDKLGKFTPKIGYPDKWRDYSSLKIVANDLSGNYKRASLYRYHRQINKLGKPIDKTEWHMSPQTVNAYYNPSMNEIVFPAAILQPPFFNMNADDAVNYGAIGGVIGHEMGHGFDDQGAKSDGDGVLRNWWTDNDLKEFKIRTQKLSDQYSKFEALPGEFINGKLTLGENIGDLGGLTIAHRAYMLSLKGQQADVIDKFSGEQRFFMGWAQVWAYKFRDKALRMRLQTDPHSPAPFRGNGTLMNMPEFMQAYDVKAEDKMYRKAEDRVKIW